MFDVLIDKFELNIKPIISFARSDSIKNFLNDKKGDDFALGMIFGESMGIFVTQVGESGKRTFNESEMNEMKLILSQRLIVIKNIIFQLG